MRDWDAFRGLGEHSTTSFERDGGGVLNRIANDANATIDNPTPQISEPTDVIPGDTSTPYTLTLGQSETGVVNTNGDEDWFRVDLVAGQSYVFTLNAPLGNNPPYDPYLELHSPTGVLISLDDDGGAAGFDSLLHFTATTTGTYYISAHYYNGPGASVPNTGPYTITFNASAPQNPINTILWGSQLPTTTVDVYFATSGQTYGGITATQSWSSAEIQAAMAALATWSAVIPVTFQQTLDPNVAEFHLVLGSLGSGVLGQMSPTSGNGAFSPTGSGWTTTGLLPGGSGFVTLVHEFGHGVGLAHPHDNGGTSEVMQGVLSEFNSYGTFDLNQGVFTTMSYNDSWATGPNGATPSLNYGGQAGPMALDIAAVQQIYGINPNTGLGSTTYTLLSTNNYYTCIWDNGGSDTITFAGGTASATIDLRAATLLNEVGGGGWVSYVTGVQGGFTIAHGVVIENATGGNGDDTITGNSANNVLIGNQGNDTINGGDGNDSMTGGVGNDALNGGLGVDTANFLAASTSATWTRSPSGSWTVAVTGGTFENTDTTTGVEFLHFSDRDVHLDTAERTYSGDGTSDILFRNTGGAVVTWNVTGTTFGSSAYLATVAPAQWTSLGSGDLNGDGRDEILWRNVSNGGVYSWQTDGAGAITAVGAIANLGAEWSFLGAGDFNGDGKDDLAWRNTNGAVYSWDMNGSTISSSGPLASLGAEWSLKGIGDFNGDGKDDFLWRNSSGGSYIWSMNDRAISVAATSTQAGNDWHIMGVGDFNGDGRDDILWQNDNGQVAEWTMNGATLTSSGFIAVVGPEWHVMGVGDYNGDGKDDILWQNDNGAVYAWMLNGASILQAGAIASVGPEWGII